MNFVNRTVWTGDNLDILRGINSECGGPIYLDPPFKSGRQHSSPISSKAAGAAFKTLGPVTMWMTQSTDCSPAAKSLYAAGESTISFRHHRSHLRSLPPVPVEVEGGRFVGCSVAIEGKPARGRDHGLTERLPHSPPPGTRCKALETVVEGVGC